MKSNKVGERKPPTTIPSTMKRELKKAISTIRKIQDAVFNICTERNLSIDCTYYEGRKWWTVFAHYKSTSEKCEM